VVSEGPVEPAVQVGLVVSEGPAALVALVVPEDPVALVVPEDPVERAVQESPVALERELAQVVVELEHVQVVPVLVQGHPRVRLVVALRTKSVTAAHPHDLVPLLEAAEDLAAAAETTRVPVAAEVGTAWEAAATAVVVVAVAVAVEA